MWIPLPSQKSTFSKASWLKRNLPLLKAKSNDLSTHFDIPLFRQHLSTQWLGQSLSYFEELESTNSHVKKLSSDEVSHGLVCLTDNQTRGRGQYERKWESQPALNLTFSMVFQPPVTGRFHVLTLACALAVVEFLEHDLLNGSPPVCIKWPNDVMINGRKLAGLLTETVFSGNKLDRVVIGMGLNVNQEEFSPELEGKATSLRLEKGEPLSREQLLGDILMRVEYKYNLWERQKSELLKSINRNIKGYGQWVGLQVDGDFKRDTYKLLGINEKGQLLMLNQDGGIESFSYEQIQLVTY